MVKKICLLLVAALAFQTGIGQQVTFQKSYGGILNDEGKAVIQLIDKSIVIAGTTLSYGAGVEDFYLIKTDSIGNVLWCKTYGSTFIDLCNYMVQTVDGGFALFGISDTGSNNFNVFLLIKTDSSGNIQWSKTYTNCYPDTYNSVQQTANGGYIFVGETFINGALNVNIALTKIDSVGNIQWSKTFGGTMHDIGNEVRQTSDGGFAIVGFTNSFGAGNRDVFIIKVDSTGMPIWTKTFGGSDSDFGFSVKETFDGGLIITGSTYNFSVGYRDAFLIKTDANGLFQWQKNYGGINFDEAFSVENTADSGFVITGFTYSFGNDYSAFLIKTDSLGNIILSKKFGGSGHEFGDLIKPTIDGGFLITGKETNTIGSDFDVYLAKTDSLGSIDCYSSNASFISTTVSTQITTPLLSISTLTMSYNTASLLSYSGCTTTAPCSSTVISENYSIEKSLSVFPNPVKDILIIESSQNILTVTVTDISGRTVAIPAISIKNGLGGVQLDLSNVSKGIYLIDVKHSEENERIKIVVE